MKPIRVSIKGFNSFVEEQVVDFEKLSAQGLFGIFGPTGSGKSTVLDAITFALYGKIARETGSSSQYINVNSDVARVVFEFEVNTDKKESYKIIRELKRNKKDEVRTSQCKFIRTTEGDEVLAEDSREVVKGVKEVIGLEYGDFVKTVVLPQGGFNDFLKMEGKDRREILERLFNLQQYGKDLETKISNRIKSVESTKSELAGAIGALGIISEEGLREQKEILDSLEEQLVESKKLLQNSDTEFRQAQELRNNQSELIKNQEELSHELGKSEQIKSQSERLKKAQQFAMVESLILSYEKTTEDGRELAKQNKKLEESNQKLQETKKIVDEVFEKTSQRYSEEYPILLKKQESISHAQKAWENSLSLGENIAKSKEKFEQKQKELEEIFLKTNELSKQQEIWREKIEKSKATIQNNSISQEEQSKLRESVRRLDKLDELNLKKSKLIEEIEQNKKNLHTLAKNLQECEQKLQKILEQKNNLQEERKAIQDNPNSDIVFVTKEKQRLGEQISLCQEWQIKSKRSKEVEELVENQLARLKNNRSQQKEYEQKIAELNILYDELFVQQGARSIRQHLHEGDICPVCSNIVGTLEDKTEDESRLLEQVAANKVELEEEVKKLQIDELSIKHQIELLQSEKAELTLFLQKNALDGAVISDIEQEIEKIEQDFERLSERSSEIELQKNQLEQKEKEYFAEEINLDASQKNLQAEYEKLDLAQKNLEKEILDLMQVSQSEQQSIDVRAAFLQMEQNLLQIEEERKKLEQSEKESRTLEEEQSEIQNMATDLQIGQSTLKAQIDGLLANKKAQEQIVISNLGELCDPKNNFLQLTEQIQTLEENHKIATEQKTQIEKQMSKLQQDIVVVQSTLQNLRNQARETQEQLYERLIALDIDRFENLEGQEKLNRLLEQLQLLKERKLSVEQMSEIERKVSIHHELIAEKNGIIKSLQAKLGDKKISDEEFMTIEENNQTLHKNFEELNKKVIGESKKYQGALEQFEKLKELYEKEGRIVKQLDMLKELKQVLGAKKFVEFMAMKQLGYVTLEATQRLYDITNGAYSLEVDDDGSFKIRDNKNGGALRNVKTLSGGETFVVSLSLALALSAQIQLKGVAPLELFFLDEGFGTLDDELLEVVMDSLEKIHHDRLKVGIISHVEQLKQRIPVKLMVTPAKMGEGGSKVKIEYS